METTFSAMSVGDPMPYWIRAESECIMWTVYCLPGDLKRGALGSGHVIALAVLVLPVTARQYVCMADTVSPPLMA